MAPEPVTALWKDGIVERLDLVGLDARAIGQLLESVLRGSVDRAVTAHLAVRCQGNVLFLRELVLGALHDGSLCDDGGIWRLVSALCPSERLVELVEARLGRLDAPERRLLVERPGMTSWIIYAHGRRSARMLEGANVSVRGRYALGRRVARRSVCSARASIREVDGVSAG